MVSSTYYRREDSERLSEVSVPLRVYGLFNNESSDTQENAVMGEFPYPYEYMVSSTVLTNKINKRSGKVSVPLRVYGLFNLIEEEEEEMKKAVSVPLRVYGLFNYL